MKAEKTKEAGNKYINKESTIEYQQYLLGNSWHCPDAPINPAIALQVQHDTGAHHWLELNAEKPGKFYCKYCFEIRRFKMNWTDGGGGNNWAGREW